MNTSRSQICSESIFCQTLTFFRKNYSKLDYKPILQSLLKAEIAARSVQADQLIASLQAQIEEIKQQAPLPAQIQETILKQENAQLR